MKRALAVLALGAAVLLSACTGLPTSGPVQPGNPPRDAEGAPPFNLLSAPPQPGASPQQIVDGFLRAGVGAQDDWATAREYLTPRFRQEWSPREGNVTIDRLSERSASAVSPAPTPAPTQAAEGTPAGTVDIVQRVTPEAFVSETGEYTPAEGRATTLPFRLVQDQGEWRIDEAPDGIVLHQEVFTTVFQQASVMYFDPTFSFLVPDVRWFARPLVAARVAQAVVDLPPSDWLHESVVTAFPEGIDLASSAVPLVDGSTARVELDAAAFTLDEVTLDRMQTQLEASLASVDIPAVEMTVGTSSLGAEKVAVETTAVGRNPLVQLADGEFGYLGTELEIIPGLSQAISGIDARSAAVSRDRTSAAVLTADGAVVRARDDGTVQPLDLERPDLLAPSIDPRGTVWSVSRTDPDAFLAFPDQGEPVSVPAAWPGAVEIAAFQVSREGARVAALVTAGGRTEVWIAGIVRNDDGTPVAIGDPHLLATSTSTGIDLAWLDGTSVGVVLRSDSGSSVLRQPIGGRGDSTTVDSGVVNIAGGNSSVRLRTDDGALLIERGSVWEEAADGVAVLGVQHGPTE